jgi:2-polyprenyl-3-methyl-5-hydroxy-6-metoxy-1,4-benzoquinol methylase
MPDIYRSADLLLGTSVDETEGFFLPAIEAMASGVPAVLTDVPCHHAYAEGTAHAVFVPPADPEAMARAVARLASDPERRSEVASAGRRVAEGFGWDRHLDVLESVLAEIRDEAAPRAARSVSVPVLGSRTSRAPRLALVETTALTSVSAVDFARSMEVVIAESRYAFAAQMVDDLRVVDVGCGRGKGTVLLAEAGARSVLGVDISEVALAYARRSSVAPGVTYRSMDACAMDLHPEDADLIVAFDVFDELADPSRFLAEAHRVLTPTGALLLSIPNPHVKGIDGGCDPGLASDRIGVVDDLRRSLEARFGRVVCFGQSLETDRLTIRPEMLDARRDVGFLMMALQPQRAPVEPETSKPERVARRRAA